MKKKELTNEEIVAQLLDVLSSAKINNDNIVPVMSLFFLSIGASLEGCVKIESENILKRYGENPTLGNAIMAQALWMKETWKG